ncbi:hypothetical protein DSO57_1006545 [Entomophthora muscae]|uniref:Uncharacterized protein n=1 Tax=Entomophthora muscae TaxID=34485 RepID=A0ACC2RYU3_9FUNG|nr:hypothetical protein DSO57_1006545 [Entomophthora muscae]
MQIKYFPSASVLQRHQTRPTWQNFQSLFSGLTRLKVLLDFESYKDRWDSSDLCKYQECFDKMGVAMIAISDQLVGSSEFIKYTDWKGEIYLDVNHEVCHGATGSPMKKLCETPNLQDQLPVEQKAKPW